MLTKLANKIIIKLIIKSFIITPACAILFGCAQTEGTLDIHGKIIDESTNKSIPNRKVIIKGWGFSDKKPIDVGEFQTDSSGIFSYTMNKKKGFYYYYFSFTGDSSYSFSTQEIPLGELEKNSKFLSFHLNKLTNFTINIERCSKIPLYDTLYVSWKTDGIEGRAIYQCKTINYGIAPDFEFRWIGGNVKSEIKTKALANKKTTICLELFRNGEKKEILDTIFCERDIDNYFTFKY